MISKLTQSSLLKGVEELSTSDKKLGLVIERFGPPPMWGRRPGYGALLKIILEQQVSLTSAEAIYKRLQSSVPKITAEHVHDLSIDGLRELGFTRQKSRYCIGLAEAILNGELVLAQLNKMSDEDAYNALLTIKGIGPWTANVYLLMVLKRPDIWPNGDLALAESARRLKKLNQRPSYEQLNKMAQKWRPWRSVAARILWHNYLCENQLRTSG